MDANEAPRLAALGDPTRHAIVELLAGELAGWLPVTRPAVSQHLAVLKNAGLVRDERAGTRRVYRLDPDGLEALAGYLDHIWNRALTAFKQTAERPSDPATEAEDEQ